MLESVSKFETKENENEQESILSRSQEEIEERLNELLERHWDIKKSGKKSFTQEEICEKDELKIILHSNKKMTDIDMANFLDLKPCTIYHFRMKYGLPSNGIEYERKDMKKGKHSYPTTERERKLIQKFMVAFLREVDEEKYRRTGYNIKGIKMKTDY